MIEIVENKDCTTWWDVARACDHATFFHTPIWHELACSTYPSYEDCTIVDATENNVKIVLPLLKINRHVNGRLSSLTSTFAGCYGGVISDSTISEEDKACVYRNILSNKVGRFRLTGNPISNDLPGLLKNRPEHEEDFTHILPLDADYPTLSSRFQSGHKRNLKKGIKLGVTVRKAKSEKDYRAYYDCYEDSLRRWGDQATSQYPWGLFQNGFLLSQKYPDNITLWLACIDERILGGAWVFYWNRHASYWHGAGYESAFKFYPNHVLHAHIIENAIERGFTFYDFLPSGNHEGVAKFKSRFGAERWPFSRWVYKTQFFRLSNSLRNMFR